MSCSVLIKTDLTHVVKARGAMHISHLVRNKSLELLPYPPRRTNCDKAIFKCLDVKSQKATEVPQRWLFACYGLQSCEKCGLKPGIFEKLSEVVFNPDLFAIGSPRFCSRVLPGNAWCLPPSAYSGSEWAGARSNRRQVHSSSRLPVRTNESSARESYRLEVTLLKFQFVKFQFCRLFSTAGAGCQIL